MVTVRGHKLDHLAINSTIAVAGKDRFTLTSASKAVVQFIMAKWLNWYPRTVLLFLMLPEGRIYRSKINLNLKSRLTFTYVAWCCLNWVFGIHSHGEWPKSRTAWFTQNLYWLKFAFHIKLESCAPHRIKKYQDHLLLYVIVRFLSIRKWDCNTKIWHWKEILIYFLIVAQNLSRISLYAQCLCV